MNVFDRLVNKYLTLGILFFAVFFPKMAVINIGYNSGIRMEDILIAAFIGYQLVTGEFLKFVMKDKVWYFTKPFLFHMGCAALGIAMTWFYSYQTCAFSTQAMFWFRQFEYVFVILAGYKCLAEWGLKNFFRFVDFVYILMAGYGILQYFGVVSGYIKGNEVVQYGDGSRVFSTTNGPYEFSGYLSIMIVYYMCRSLYFNRNKLFYAFTVSAVVLILMTESRMALAAALVAVVLVLFQRSFLLGLLSSMVGAVAYLVKELVGYVSSSNRLSRFETLNLKEMYDAFIYDFQHGDFQYFLKNGMWIIYYNTSDNSYNIRISRWGTAFDGLCTSIFTFMFGCGMAVISTMDGNYMRFFFESGLIGLICWIVFIYRVYQNTKIKFDCSKNLYMFSHIMKYSIIALLLQAIMIDVFEASKIMSQLWFLYGGYLYMYEKERNESMSVA